VIQNIRNFCIIAHIDHGKSTLADRLLEVTNTLDKRKIKDRTLDTLELEQERGITIKLQTARMQHEYKGNKVAPGTYILNLIDTPGHVDFSYEVSRSVAACEGALLLVDATQGVQAQTLSVMYKALDADLQIIPVINKVDLPSADVDRTKLEMMETFGFKEDEIILASGKSGIGVQEILDAIVERVQPPKPAPTALTRALIFDSFFHEYKGAIALIKIVEGEIRRQQKLFFIGTSTELKPVEVGYLNPEMLPQESVKVGEVGYIATGLKDLRQIHVGDTVTLWSEDQSHLRTALLAGYLPPKPMVYASLYPIEANDFPDFQEAIQKLALNDSALTFQKESSQALGTGFVCGFLGLLHLEVVQERLDREFNIDLISTNPTVEFKIELTTTDLSKAPNINTSRIDERGHLNVRMAGEFPDGSLIKQVLEPWVKLEVFTPEAYIGPVMELCQQHRGVYIGMDFTTHQSELAIRHAVIRYEMPTVEIILNFFDQLKSISHGYASMDYTPLDYRPGQIVKVGILVNGEEAEALSFLVHKDFAERRGRQMVEKLVEIIPRQNFKVPIQAAIGGKVIARADIQAYRKDVTAKLYGGDETRKRKLLDKQKKGKKKMKAIGKVEIPKEAFLAALKMED
jgi:GTP-binding protein LepA